MTQLKWQYIQLPCWCEIKPYIDSNKEIKNKDPRFIINDTVIISKYKSVFAKGYTPNWSEEVFWLKKLRTLFRGHILLVVLTGKMLLERFKKMNCKEQIKINLELKKQSNEEEINYILNGKVMIVPLIVE